MKYLRHVQESSEIWPLKWIIPLVSCGYLSGIGLILLWYEWQPAQRERDLTQLWLLLVILGLLCMTMLFSRAVRCILTLALPSLCSSRGRALLIALAFYVAARGPTANILANLMALLRSLACGQELLRLAIGQMLDVVMEPVRAVHMAIDQLLEELRRVLQQVLQLLLRIQSYLLVIIDAFKVCAAWLESVLELCNSELGTPWTRCQQAAERAQAKCRARLGMLKSLCHAAKLFLALCYPARLVDVFCAGVWDDSWQILDTIMKRYYEFVAQLEQMFDVSISFEHNFKFHTNASKKLSDVGDEVMQDIQQRLRPFFIFQSWLDLLCWLMLLAILIKAIYFYLRYMLGREYQNIYLTSALYAIERDCEAKGQPTALPLKSLERAKYLKLTSLRLSGGECLMLAENAFFMLNTCVQLGSICLLDYSMFWLLDSIAYYGEEQDDLEIPAYVDLEIEGGGFVGDIMRGIANAFRPITQKTKLDSKSCLPLPVEPDYRYYAGILLLCLLAWLILLTEPYALRLRHLIMQRFYPERAHVRALYLQRKIIEKRGCFFKMARRKARALFRHQQAGGHVGCLGKLLRCCCCLCFWPVRGEDVCILCAQLLSSSTRVKCDTPGCKGVYCQACLRESNGKCCLCQRPADYGDYSDLSEGLLRQSGVGIIWTNQGTSSLQQISQAAQQKGALNKHKNVFLFIIM
ncbi:DC-STAMP domain-containing protein 2 isoform X3 [Drosophila virilis]|uniref:DC-STAMP domain-containing protein 2 isoform X3 n=1 Tax=Drosophila virilis TaxID=7244 RepID=UPI0013963332|nr:DC-STAMP domain-containing protein 2 isoform X3 [Drosophila virilis]